MGTRNKETVKKSTKKAIKWIPTGMVNKWWKRFLEQIYLNVERKNKGATDGENG